MFLRRYRKISLRVMIATILIGGLASFAIWRPDLKLALAWIDTYTSEDETNILAEIGVWYLSHSEHESIYEPLGKLLRQGCFAEGGNNTYPAHYARRVLGAQENERATQVLLDVFTRKSFDGVDNCVIRAGEGLALQGERIVPLMLQVATDPNADLTARVRAMRWLASMIGNERFIYYCKSELGCKTLPPETVATWVDPMIDLLHDDPASVIRGNASLVLSLIGDPRGIEEIRKQILVEPDETMRELMESDIEASP